MYLYNPIRPGLCNIITGPQITKWAEISRFLCLGLAIVQLCKNVCISANFWNRSPIFCMKGQFSKLAEILLFLCLNPAIGQFYKNVRISAKYFELESILYVQYRVFCNYGSKITFSKKYFFLEQSKYHKLAALVGPHTKKENNWPKSNVIGIL